MTGMLAVYALVALVWLIFCTAMCADARALGGSRGYSPSPRQWAWLALGAPLWPLLVLAGLLYLVARGVRVLALALIGR